MKHIRSVVKKEGWLCAAYIALGVLLSFLEVYWSKVTQLTLDDLSGGALPLRCGRKHTPPIPEKSMTALRPHPHTRI